MSGKSEDRKELATNRLLEVLRGKETAEVETSVPVAVGLSDEEENALLSVPGDLPSEIPHAGEPAAKSAFSPRRSFNIGGFLKSIQNVRRWILGEKLGTIGLDIGSYAIKYVKIINDAAGGELVDFGMVPFPRPVEEGKTLSPAEKADFLFRFLGHEVTRNFAISTAVCGSQTSIRHIILPKVAKNEMRDAVTWNAKKDLPFPIENSLIDFQIVREFVDKGVPKMSIVAALAERPVIDSHLDFLKLAEMQPSNIVAVPLAIFQAYSSWAEREGIKDGIIIDIGATTSYIIFVGEGYLQFAREISTGGNEITEGIMGSISTGAGMVKINWDEAEQLKKEYGIPLEDTFNLTPSGISLTQVGSMLRPVLERLITQIQRSIDYYRSKFSFGDPERVYLSGGTALMKNIVPYLTDSLNKEIHLLNAVDLFKLSKDLKNRDELVKMAPVYAVACGLVLGIKKGINLLPPEIQVLEKISFQKRMITLAAIFILVFLSILSISVESKVSESENELRRVSTGGGATSDIVREYNGLLKTRDGMRDQITGFQNQLKESMPSINVSQILKLLSTLTPDYITVNSLEMRNDAIKVMEIKGAVHGNAANLEVLVAQYSIMLEESKYFMKVRPYDVGKTDEISGQMDFTITCEL